MYINYNLLFNPKLIIGYINSINFKRLIQIESFSYKKKRRGIILCISNKQDTVCI